MGVLGGKHSKLNQTQISKLSNKVKIIKNEADLY